MILFQWTGASPRDARIDHRWQVACAAVFPSRAAFMRATGTTPTALANYVSIDDNPDENIANEGARLALANPGIIYWQDALRHIPRDAPWLRHSDPQMSGA